MIRLPMLLSAGYMLADRDAAASILPAGLRARMAEFPGSYIVFDPADDADGFCLVGDDLEELISEASRHLELESA